MKKPTRREFVASLGAGSLFLAVGRPGPVSSVFGQGLQAGYAQLDPTNPFNFIHPLKLPSDSGVFGMLSPENITLTAREVRFDLAPGVSANGFAYVAFENLRTYWNPILRASKGQHLHVTHRNALSENSIIHWHGLSVDWLNDGHPVYEISPGGVYHYAFEVQNRAGTYIYHTHAMGRVGRQMNAGLVSAMLIDDEAEIALREALDLTPGVTDVPLIIQDRRFNNGTFDYNPTPPDLLAGFVGDVILTNFGINPTMDVDARVYRFRILNAANARTLRIAVTRGAELARFDVIGNDQLLDRPYQVQEVFLAPGERVEVLLDLRPYRDGDILFLQSLPFDPMHQEHGGHSVPNRVGQFSRLSDGEQFYILKLNVKQTTTYDRRVPDVLSEVKAINAEGAEMRTFSIVAPDFMPGGDFRWRINGRLFSADEFPVAAKRNSTEVWEMRNANISMPHPMHLHGFPFQVLERKGSPGQIQRLAIDSNGLLPTDKGWKDTVLVWPGEVVTVAIDFTHNFGGEQLFLFHCHNLEHADNGMVMHYKVV
ncbi:MAG: multicopper oxidase family protein [Acidobacteria bacterium]|nr:multicopper oxidase family protein [Acidobacteriota bacterium]